MQGSYVSPWKPKIRNWLCVCQSLEFFALKLLVDIVGYIKYRCSINWLCKHLASVYNNFAMKSSTYMTRALAPLMYRSLCA